MSKSPAGKKNAFFILKIRDEKGEMVQSFPEKAKVFHTDYRKLYNVSQSEDYTGEQKKPLKIQQYLQALDSWCLKRSWQSKKGQIHIRR